MNGLCKRALAQGALALGFLGGLAPAAAESFVVDPGAGKNTMSAVFEAPLGERITAMSGQVGCNLDIDTQRGTASGKCRVPLTSITVDSEPLKAEHFQQWATNKKSDPKDCYFELSIENAKVADPVKPETPLAFETLAPFTICGRSREDGGKEKIAGEAVLLPAGKGEKGPTVRIRAKIADFNREAYHVGPKWTDGWLARVQRLAPVVSATGTIEVTLFAHAGASR